MRNLTDIRPIALPASWRGKASLKPASFSRWHLGLRNLGPFATWDRLEYIDRYVAKKMSAIAEHQKSGGNDTLWGRSAGFEPLASRVCRSQGQRSCRCVCGSLSTGHDLSSFHMSSVSPLILLHHHAG